MSYSSRGKGLLDLLLATLQSSRSTKVFRDILRERELTRYKQESVRSRLYKLRAKRYVTNTHSGWSLTKRGERLSEKRALLSYIPSPFSKQCPAGIVLAFDIPERDRKIRNWLRNQIKIFGYKMLQQSLWIGPGPLPPLFLKRLENLGIRKNVKTFKISTKK